MGEIFSIWFAETGAAFSQYYAASSPPSDLFEGITLQLQGESRYHKLSSASGNGFIDWGIFPDGPPTVVGHLWELQVNYLPYVFRGWTITFNIG